MIVNDPAAESEETGRRIRLISAESLLNCEDERDPMLDIPQERLAYCIYTSGTTGVPKGAMLSHRGIVNITDPDNNPFNRDIVKCGTGIVAIGSVCFDISLFEFFVPLFNGRFIEFAPESAMTDPEELAALIKKHGANMLHCTPSRLSAYLKNAVFSDALNSVEVILAAGEALPGSLVTELNGKYGIRVYNGYGPTETTIGATVTDANDDTSIGRPIANAGVMILDEKGRLLPYGVIGELFVYGNGLGLGYQDMPEETAKRFVEYYGRKMYKTGDLARFLPDGRVAYHGRNDFQVKLHGLRIELPEIESCILSYEGVGGVCVQVRKIGVSEHLVAFFCPKEGASVDKAALKEYVRERLTYYMVPDIFKELDRIPETPGGKTDTKALAAIPIDVEGVYRAPQTPYQIAICEAFAVVLEMEKVGLDDNFFDNGGDSLHTAELLHEIASRLPEAEAAYEDIFRYPTPELLAQYLYIKHTEKDRRRDNPLEHLD
ncbi:MAG: AMP-binding protein, partial [Synergistes sp.]|nr:AMP-binding protein [Synergistes sp.]